MLLFFKVDYKLVAFNLTKKPMINQLGYTNLHIYCFFLLLLIRFLQIFKKLHKNELRLINTKDHLAFCNSVLHKCKLFVKKRKET